MDSEALRQLADELEIRNVIARWARALDRMDIELLRTCYHPNAVEDRGRYVGPVEGFFEWIQTTVGALESTWHLVGSPLVELDGDSSYVETYCLGIQRTRSASEEAGEDRLIPCRYVDRFERRDGQWKIAERVAVYEAPWAQPAAAAGTLGKTSTRDRSDPVYR